jgi:hypothetical protein
MAKKAHPADAADLAKIAGAKTFNVHFRTGPGEKVNRTAKTLAAAVRIADKLGTTPGGKRPMIYAVTAEGETVHVPAAMIAQARDGAPAPKAAAKPEPAPERAATAKPMGKRAAILAAAQAGTIPAEPDFSAPTHTRFRKKLAEVVAMVEAGDIERLKAFAINPVSSSSKAIARYRDLAVIALEAKGTARPASRAEGKVIE